MKEEKYRDNRGNVVLLTVIAIVTMVIVLVGATFAYLASNIDGSRSANINATTNAGSDLFLITPGVDLSLTANETNFGPDNTNLSVNSTATILFQTTNTATTGVTKNYEVKLEVVANNFEYTSGKCYQKPTGSDTILEGVTSKNNCTGTNMWATDGTSYACYERPTAGFAPVLGSSYTNQLSCLSRSSYIWAPDEVAELVIDLYKNDPAITAESSCTQVGACVNNKREITGATTEGTCDGTWLPNIWEDGICYHLETAKDITKAPSESVVQLIDNVAITAKSTVNNGTTTDYYKPVVTFINFDHNQIINGQKNFGASLTFALIS